VSILVALLIFCCLVAICGCWLVLADIRVEMRRAVREYERGLSKDVRSRVQ
jgi:hypothetical protein